MAGRSTIDRRGYTSAELKSHLKTKLGHHMLLGQENDRTRVNAALNHATRRDQRGGDI
jgi:hypothetical protein